MNKANQILIWLAIILVIITVVIFGFYTILYIECPELKQKLFDEWGERTTLFHSIDKLVSTLKELNVMACDKPGKYYVNAHRVSNPKIVAFMLNTVMLVDNRGYYTLVKINEILNQI